MLISELYAVAITLMSRLKVKYYRSIDQYRWLGYYCQLKPPGKDPDRLLLVL